MLYSLCLIYYLASISHAPLLHHIFLPSNYSTQLHLSISFDLHLLEPKVLRIIRTNAINNKKDPLSTTDL